MPEYPLLCRCHLLITGDVMGGDVCIPMSNSGSREARAEADTIIGRFASARTITPDTVIVLLEVEASTFLKHTRLDAASYFSESERTP